MSSTLASAAVMLAAAAAAAGVAGCGRPAPVPTPVPGPVPAPVPASIPAPVPPPTPVLPPAGVVPAVPAPVCLLAAPPTSGPDTVTIAVADTIDPAHAPVPRHTAEQLLFALLYPPLIRVDCTGTPLGAAAMRWNVDTAGKTWTLALADNGRFWSGMPVTAADVVAGWGDVHRLGIDTAVAIDGRHVAVTFAAPSSVSPPAVPLVFGDPALAVRRRDSAALWVEGSGPYRPATTTPGAIVIVPANSADSVEPVVVFRRWPGRDLRDALDGGADLLITDEPAAIAYAGTRSDFQVAPLAWDRTYVLVSAAPAALDDGQRAALARDAVDVDARAAAPPYWWAEHGCNPAGTDTARAPAVVTPAARVVYRQGDRVAGRLAERLVALQIGGRRAVAVGLDSAALDRSLRTGRDAAYVLPWPTRLPTATCDVLPHRPGGMPVEPLIETRRHAIVRRGTIGLSIDAAGRPWLELR